MTDYNNPLFLQKKKKEKKKVVLLTFFLKVNFMSVKITRQIGPRGCHVLVTSPSQSQAGASSESPHVPQTPGPLPALSPAQDPHSVGEEESSVLRAAQHLTLPAEPADEQAG